MQRLARWPLIAGTALFLEAAFVGQNILWVQPPGVRVMAIVGALLCALALLGGAGGEWVQKAAAGYVVVYCFARAATGYLNPDRLGTHWVVVGLSLAIWIGLAWSES